MHIHDHQRTLDQAMQQHQLGHLEEAKKLYEIILKDEPKHFTSLHLLGVVACQQQFYEQGIDLIKKALTLNPRSLSAHINLVNALEKIGQIKAAAICSAQLLEFEPSNQEVLIKTALLLEKLYLNDQAILFLDKALQLKKDYLVYFYKGNIFLNKKNAIEALSNFKLAISLKPDFVDAYANAGTALISLNKPQEAIMFYDQALQIDSNNIGIKINRELAVRVQAGANKDELLDIDKCILSIQQLIDQSEVLVALNDIEAAIIHIRHGIVQYPDSRELYNRQGLVFLAAKNQQEALLSFNYALKIDANYSQAMINLASTLIELREFQEAINVCRNILKQEPDNAIAINNIGSALAELNQREKALHQFEHALELMPEAEFVKLNMAFCHLAAGDYEKGFPLYEYRWQGELLKSKYYIPRPMWSGKESLAGKTIFLYGEQGFGDSFQFSRYINLLAHSDCKVLLGVNDSIKALFKRSFSFVELTDKSKPLPHLDYHCPLGSLPLAFNTTIQTIPANVPYLVANHLLVDKWRKILPGTKPRIGVVWRGNPDNPVERKRALPLSLLISLFELEAVFINLKIDTNNDERLILDKQHVLCFDSQIDDFDDTAAIIENLDLIISTDTSIAHLAGAMGKPVWLMLAFSPDWRWHINRSDSPWYPTMHLFRQPFIDDWSAVVVDVKLNLKKWIKQYQK